MKKIITCISALFLIFIFSACARETIVAFIKDGTSAGSDNYTINVSFVEDSEFDEKFIDVLVKSDTDDLTMTFKREFDEDIILYIENKDEWYSLTNLINNANSNEAPENYMAFSEKNNMTLVMKSEQDAVIKLKVVCGDEMENTQEEHLLVNQVDVSNEFSLDLGKNH